MKTKSLEALCVRPKAVEAAIRNLGAKGARRVRSVREGLLAVGLSVASTLPFGAFMAAFTGLQEYWFPTILATLSRVLSGATLVVLLLVHGTLVELALVMAAFNVVTAMMEFLGWRKYVKARVDFAFAFFHRETAVRLVDTPACSLSGWSQG